MNPKLFASIVEFIAARNASAVRISWSVRTLRLRLRIVASASIPACSGSCAGAVRSGGFGACPGAGPVGSGRSPWSGATGCRPVWASGFSRISTEPPLSTYLYHDPEGVTKKEPVRP